jgi:beta-glucosidase
MTSDPPPASTHRPRSRRRARLIGVGVALAALGGGYVAVTTSDASAASCPWVNSTAPVADRVTQLMAAMTPLQKTAVLHGNGEASPYIGNISAVPELCIPAIGLQDGPSGVGDGLGGVTQMPAGVNAAATFDSELVGEYGTVIGNEFAGKGVDVALGPTINIARDPRWGRNFEAFGEDPYLAGQMAVADVKGIQSEGVMAQVKHAAVYNIELGAARATPADNAIVDNRTLNEIYLPAFQAAASQGAAASMMCSYNMINGIYACESDAALNKGIKQAANWGGFVTSDWGAIHSLAPSAIGGEDMEMPGGGFFAQGLVDAVSQGQVTQARFDDMVSRVLTQMFTFGLFDKTKSGTPTATVTTDAHKQTARQVAADSAVLLKNADNVLPLGAATTSIAILGGDALDAQSTGGGSATVSASAAVNPIDGIKNRAGTGVDVQFVEGAGERTTTPDIAAAVTAAKAADVAVVFASYSTQELSDLQGIDLPGQQNDLITQVAAANPHTIVVLNTGSAVTMPWLDKVAGVIEDWYPGQENGNAIASVLFGDVNPSGKLPVSFPKSLADVPAATAQQWPGQDDKIDYSEGMYVGYRWYDAKKIEPLFPFGYGLSYTTFAMSNLEVGTPDAAGNTTVTATVTNSGSTAGAEVAQLYVGQPADNGEPPKQLKGFQKVSLAAGASATVTFPLTSRDLAHWDDSAGKWVTSAGDYSIMVGDSSTNLPLTSTVTVAATANPATTSTLASSGVSVINPGGMSSPSGTKVSLQIKGTGSGVTYQAAGLPAGLAIDAATGLISGTPTTAGSTTVTVTATGSNTASSAATFVWTTT